MNPRILVLAVTCHMLTGSASVAMRYLASDLPPIDIAFLRYFLGGFFVLPLAFLYRTRIPDGKMFLSIIFLGLLFFALFPWLVATAFKYTTAARGALVLSTMPLWSMLLGYVLKHEALSWRRELGIGMAILGVGLTLYEKLVLPVGNNGDFTGETIMLAAAILGAIYSILSKQTLHNTSAFLFTPTAMLAGCLFLMPFSVTGGLAGNLLTLEFTPLIVMLYLGICGGGLAFLFFNWVLDKTTPTIITMFVTLNPLTAIFLAWWLLDEELTRFFFLGAGLVLAGLILALLPGRVAVSELT